MSGPNSVLDKGFLATTQIRQYRAVKLDTSEVQAVQVVDTAGERAVGVIQDQALTDDRDVGERVVNVRMLGITWCVASAAIAAGVQVAVTANGRIATATSGDIPIGVTTNAADAEGDHVEVLLTPGQNAVPA